MVQVGTDYFPSKQNDSGLEISPGPGYSRKQGNPCFACNGKSMKFSPLLKLSVYNVSQQKPIDKIKLLTAAPNEMVVEGSKIFLALKNGSVAVSDVGTKRLEYLSAPAHSQVSHFAVKCAS